MNDPPPPPPPHTHTRRPAAVKSHCIRFQAPNALCLADILKSVVARWELNQGTLVVPNRLTSRSFRRGTLAIRREILLFVVTNYSKDVMTEGQSRILILSRSLTACCVVLRWPPSPCLWLRFCIFRQKVGAQPRWPLDTNQSAQRCLASFIPQAQSCTGNPARTY